MKDLQTKRKVDFSYKEVLGFMNEVFEMESEFEYEVVKDAVRQTYNDLFLKIMMPYETGLMVRDAEEQENFDEFWVNTIEDIDIGCAPDDLETTVLPIRFTSSSFHYFFEEFFHILPTSKSEQYRIVILFSKYSDKKLNEYIKNESE